MKWKAKLLFLLIVVISIYSVNGKNFLKNGNKDDKEGNFKENNTVEQTSNQEKLISDFDKFKKMFKINQSAFRRSNPLDNSDTDDCPAQLMVDSWNSFQDTFPLKYQACNRLWKNNDGLPGQKIIEEFNKIDKDFNKDNCPQKTEYDTLQKTNPSLMNLTIKLMPLTFEKCQKLWKDGPNALIQ